MLLLMPILLVTGLLFFIFSSSPWHIITGMIIIEIMLGLQGALLSGYLQRHVKSAYRSTIESLSGFYSSIYRASLFLLLGIAAELFSLQFALSILLAVMLFMIIPPLWLLVKGTRAT